MLVSMAVLALSVANAAGAAGYIFGIPYVTPGPRTTGFDLTLYETQTLTASLGTASVALVIWISGWAWQRHWPETRDRLGYMLLGYGLGTVILLIGTAYTIAGAIRFARDPAEVGAFTSVWSAVASGLVLVVVHAVVLFRDRGRNGHPVVTTDRLLLAFPALAGLGAVVGGLGLAWHALLERDVMLEQVVADDLSRAVALLAIGVLAYAPAWREFNARTTAGSAVRRFYLFTVVCLALVAGLASGVIVLYSAITAVAGVGEADATRTARTWVVPTVALTAIFASHLTLLMRDQRLTRVADAAAPADPLVVLLEDVRSGRVSVERAAATIRGPVA